MYGKIITMMKREDLEQLRNAIDEILEKDSPQEE